ncbi:MAG: aspartyl/glutamyl-tRNA amidotransferase subunit C [Deltaproteobacteria bacterium]|nr:aspartyl/glutamyl-tRNA amidotransferase subunit C [Deltaproteobacteria bacterium]
MAETTDFSVDESTVAKVADLANLQLSAAELIGFQTQLTRILRYAVDLRDLKAEQKTADQTERFAFESQELEREDQCLASLPPELALGNATKTEGTAFSVPRVID